MSVINELTSKTTAQTYSAKVSENNSTKNFDSVMIEALQNANGKRPAHLCCCENPVVASDSLVKAEERATNSVADPAIQSQTSETTESISAGSCFTLFIRVSARITTEVGEALSGKFKDTTLAFAESLKSDKTYNENLLKAFMEKTDEKLSMQKTELKSYVSAFFEEIIKSLKSAFSGLDSTVLSSSNLLGSSLANYANLLGNSNSLGSNSASSSLLSSLSSSLIGSSSSSSLMGYSALDVANAKIMGLNNAGFGSNYISGVALNTNRYAGRSIKIIKTAEIQQTASVSKENTMAPASGSAAKTKESNEVLAETSNDKAESALLQAMESRNNIIDLFKNMILTGLTTGNTGENLNIDKIKAEVNLSLV